MPTNLIGRFNELLHNLSSSSSNSNPSSSSNNTTSTTTQQQCRRHPPTRSSSSRTVSTTNNNNQQQHHHQHNTNHSRSSSSNRGRNVVVKRSSSSNQQNNKQLLNTNNNHHSRNNRHNKNNTSNHEGSSTNKCEIDSSQNLHRNQQYRQHHRVSSSSQCRHLSHSSSTPLSSSKRESNNLDSNNLHQAQQNQSRRHQRRHSIESLTSVANNNINIKKSTNLHHNPSGKLISRSSYNNTENKSSIMIASKNNNNNHNNNNNNIINLKNPAEEKNGNNENNTKDNFGGHFKYFPVIMKPPIARNNSTNNNQDIDESLTSMLVRKMRIGAITRKNHSQNPTQIFHKKISKIAKKDVESELDDGDSKNSFIYRYLDGHLTKQHPDIISGKTCYDMPVKDIEILETKVVAACTGPNGGLLTVNSPSNKPFELAVDDVDFIDEDYPDSSLSSNGCCESTSPSPQNSAKLLSSTSTVSSSTDTGEGTVTFSNCGSDDTDKSSPYKKNSSCSEPIAGVDNWNRSSDFAYGISTTLYESHPSTKQKAGDPIADSYGICVRENSAILALADGVNWGEGACLASRCAIHGCIDYLNKALYSTAESTRSRNTMDIFIALLRSFNAAHNTILSQGGHLTTLCVAVICQLKDSDRFIVCTCNVGDSLAYVYSTCHGVREITQGSHDIFSMRDMRDALGALGPVSGSEPELNNLTVAMTIVDVGDIVFLTSDGISDNFDPVVGKFAIPKKEQPQDGEINDATDKHSSKKACENLNLMAKQSKKKNGNTTTTGRKIVQRSNSNPEKSSARHLNYTSRGLPLVSAQQRHELTLLRMEDLIMNGVNNISLSNKKKTARELCSLMVDFSTKLTMAKRRILEDPELYSEDEEERPANEIFEKQRRRRRLVGQKLAQVPGKLDHATIAAVEIGFHGLKAREMAANKKYRQPMYNSNKHSLEARYNLKLKATLARFESQDSLESINEAGPI